MKQIHRFMLKELQARIQEESLPFIQVVIGPRQTGKSTLIGQIAESWHGNKELASADGVVPLGPEWISFLWQKAIEKPGVTLLAIDEIQKVKNWSEALKVLFDRDRLSNKLRIILSGSASLSLQRGLTESLAGRFELVRCPHWGLDESREAFAWDLTTHLKFGGYPAPAALIKSPPRWKNFMQDGIIEPVLGRDLQSAVQIQKPALFRQLFALTMNYPAQEISYQKLLGQLQDRGNAATIKHYLEVLKGGFLIEILEKYSESGIVRKSSSPKIIPMAPALIHAFNDPSLIDSDPEWRGRVFEAAIGAHLVRSGCELFYWREDNAEIDFVAKWNREVFGIEVKSGRRKRTNGAVHFKNRFPHARIVILDWNTGGQFLAMNPTREALQALI